MNIVVPWAELVALITPHARGVHHAFAGRPPVSGGDDAAHPLPATVVDLSDPALEKELRERPLSVASQ
jgi:hypothetical protein